jgi:hypothetical protein
LNYSVVSGLETIPCHSVSALFHLGPAWRIHSFELDFGAVAHQSRPSLEVLLYEIEHDISEIAVSAITHLELLHAGGAGLEGIVSKRAGSTYQSGVLWHVGGACDWIEPTRISLLTFVSRL